MDKIVQEKSFEFAVRIVNLCKYLRKEYSINITNHLHEKECFDAVILAVAHEKFLDINIKSLVKENSVIYDVKGFLGRDIIDGRL